MKKVVICTAVAALILGGALVACTPEDACASRPGGGSGSSSGSRSSGTKSSSYRGGNSGFKSSDRSYRAPSNTKTKPHKSHTDWDDLFEDDDDNEGCDD